jgi:hypothetical protein
MSDQTNPLSPLAVPDGIGGDLTVECVILDASGRPKRRRVTPLAALLQPLTSRADQQGRPFGR